MEAALYTLTFVLVVLALVGTIWVAQKPGETAYGQKTKENYSRLTWIYMVSTLISLIIFALFLPKIRIEVVVRFQGVL